MTVANLLSGIIHAFICTLYYYTWYWTGFNLWQKGLVDRPNCRFYHYLSWWIFLQQTFYFTVALACDILRIFIQPSCETSVKHFDFYFGGLVLPLALNAMIMYWAMDCVMRIGGRDSSGQGAAAAAAVAVEAMAVTRPAAPTAPTNGTAAAGSPVGITYHRRTPSTLSSHHNSPVPFRSIPQWVNHVTHSVVGVAAVGEALLTQPRYVLPLPYSTLSPAAFVALYIAFIGLVRVRERAAHRLGALWPSMLTLGVNLLSCAGFGLAAYYLNSYSLFLHKYINIGLESAVQQQQGQFHEFHPS